MPMKVNRGGELQPTNSKGQYQKDEVSKEVKDKDTATKSVKELKKKFNRFGKNS